MCRPTINRDRFGSRVFNQNDPLMTTFPRSALGQSGFVPGLSKAFVAAGMVAAFLIPSRGSFAQSADKAPAGTRPNIVLILADDFGYECVGANGGTSYKTPHLDRLAAGGARFEHGYAQPLCTPTRVQLMTGQLNVRNYVRFGFLDPQQPTFASVLKNAGYATGIFGKWQLANGADAPARFGFETDTLWQLTRRPPRYANPGLEVEGKPVDFTGGEYGPDVVQNAALEFIDRNHDQPFLLYYPMMLTHGPFQPTPGSRDWDPKAIGENVNNDPRHFADMVSHLDGHVGQLVAHLEKHQLREKTLILFVGDNGTGGRISSQWAGQTVEGGKGTTTDAGMRVPLIVNWPGRVPSGTVVRDLVDTTDFLPTLCDAAGVALPKDIPLDGRSFLPQAEGRPGHPREWLYVWYWPNQQGNQENEGNNRARKPPVEFARTHRYKLFGDGRLFELDGRYGETLLDTGTLSQEAVAARDVLKKAIAQYADARPEALRTASSR